jgi:mannobiose 2-epimerase
MQKQLISEFENELNSILSYWAKYTIDQKNGGFLGALDNENKVTENAPKGAVMNGLSLLVIILIRTLVI